MASGCFAFDQFLLDPADRQLIRGGVPVELNARYFDALALLVREQGRLVSKERFLDEVWRGVPVTDEALTQCIRTLRRQLGDDAANPRFIETVPKHGYRFVAPVAEAGSARLADRNSALAARPEVLRLGAAGTAGACAAGVVGGLFYGFLAAVQAGQTDVGGASVLLVLTVVTVVIALLGGAGVSFGIAAAQRLSAGRAAWGIAGGAAGGLVIGGLVKLLGLDALMLLFGHAPRAITGAAEGALLGGAAGFGWWLAVRSARSLRRGAAYAAAIGGATGAGIALLGGRMLGGSLDLLVQGFPASRLRLDSLGGLFGENGFGPVSRIVTGGLEGALFAGCLVAAMLFARRRGD
ncbi:transcriptional regulator [Sphingosinithalassobacter sp. CS137]|uniref:winged helix-turn-helix domain-containing protein n=1 Tax=Sphingosinithalassobacter sp. CS137 TaxID=2762748 RepID=UPI00165EA872|nr:transcriptional regulator [Sphingosinithalassobacter sp. CS137]